MCSLRWKAAGKKDELSGLYLLACNQCGEEYPPPTVLLSIKPQWREKIIFGDKAVEVRKTLQATVMTPYQSFSESRKVFSDALYDTLFQFSLFL